MVSRIFFVKHTRPMCCVAQLASRGGAQEQQQRSLWGFSSWTNTPKQGDRQLAQSTAGGLYCATCSSRLQAVPMQNSQILTEVRAEMPAADL